MKNLRLWLCFAVIILNNSLIYGQIYPDISKTKTIYTNVQPPLFKINDRVYELVFDALTAFSTENIQTINIVKGETGITKYGERAKYGVVEITTKNISNQELNKIIALNSLKFEPLANKKYFKIKGNVKDCEQNLIYNATVTNLNSKIEVQTDAEGNFEIEVTDGTVLEFFQFGFKSQRFYINNSNKIEISLKSIVETGNSKPNIRILKPIIYLYPERKTDISLKLNFNGKLQTTFPNYDKSWKVEAYPDGKIFDKKSNRFYNSLFWDGELNFEQNHYVYENGFIVSRDNLTNFLIEKLEQIGLNNNETNDFVQFWLPILEKNEFNFVHFLVNEKYDAISKNEILPKPDTSILVFMEFYKTSSFQKIVPQNLIKTNRKGFTIVEWGGSDVSSKILQNLN